MIGSEGTGNDPGPGWLAYIWWAIKRCFSLRRRHKTGW
jgi:hypothetical protein